MTRLRFSIYCTFFTTIQLPFRISDEQSLCTNIRDQSTCCYLISSLYQPSPFFPALVDKVRVIPAHYQYANRHCPTLVSATYACLIQQSRLHPSTLHGPKSRHANVFLSNLLPLKGMMNHSSDNERQPLLPPTNGHIKSSAGHAVWQWPIHAILAIKTFLVENPILICTFALQFCTYFAKHMVEVPTIKLFEQAICNRYYSDQSIHLRTAQDIDEGLCKVPAIQNELATLTGLKFTFDALPGLLTALYYGSIADKYDAQVHNRDRLLTWPRQIWKTPCTFALLRRNFVQPFMDSIHLLCRYELAGKARMAIFNLPLRGWLSTGGQGDEFYHHCRHG